MLTAVAAAFVVGARCRAAVAVALGLLAVGALTVLNQLVNPGDFTLLNDLVFFLAVIGAPVVVGAVWQARARQIEQLDRLLRERREQRTAEVHAVRLEEQTRILAGVQHDVIQSMGAIVLRSAGASRTGVEVEDALRQIEASARAALDGLRAHIGLLRQPCPEVDPVPAAASSPAVPPLGWPGLGWLGLGWLDLAAAAFALPLAVESVLGGQRTGPAWLNVGLALLLAPPLALRRRHPLLATATGFGVTTVMSLLATPPATTVSAIIPVLLLAYGVGAYPRPWQARAAGVALMWSGTVGVVLATPPALRDPAGLVPLLVWTGLAVVGGILAAGVGDRARARARLVDEIEQGRSAELQLALARERHSIARNLHDSVASTMTVVCVHAAAARRSQGQAPERVRTALQTIEDTARDGLAELRASLDLLDEDAASPVRAPVPLGAGLHEGAQLPAASSSTPSGPGAASTPGGGSLDLDAVLEVGRALGLTVHADLTEAGPELAGKGNDPCEAVAVGELTTRVVREALVNAARYAPGSRVDVRIADSPAGRRVDVCDSGASAADGTLRAAGTGHGLSGLAERIEAAGGRLEFGDTRSGFRVSALLPTPAATRHPGGAHRPTRAGEAQVTG